MNRFISKVMDLLKKISFPNPTVDIKLASETGIELYYASIENDGLDVLPTRVSVSSHSGRSIANLMEEIGDNVDKIEAYHDSVDKYRSIEMYRNFKFDSNDLSFTVVLSEKKHVEAFGFQEGVQIAYDLNTKRFELLSNKAISHNIANNNNAGNSILGYIERNNSLPGTDELTFDLTGYGEDPKSQITQYFSSILVKKLKSDLASLVLARDTVDLRRLTTLHLIKRDSTVFPEDMEYYEAVFSRVVTLKINDLSMLSEFRKHVFYNVNELHCLDTRPRNFRYITPERFPSLRRIKFKEHNSSEIVKVINRMPNVNTLIGKDLIFKDKALTIVGRTNKIKHIIETKLFQSCAGNETVILPSLSYLYKSGIHSVCFRRYLINYNNEVPKYKVTSNKTLRWRVSGYKLTSKPKEVVFQFRKRLELPEIYYNFFPDVSEDNAIQLLDDPYYSDQRISEPRIPVLPKIKIPEQIDEERFFSPVIEPEMSRPENLQPMPSQYGSMQNVNSFSRNDVVEDVFDPSSLLGEDLSNLVDEEPFDLSEDSSSFINEEPFDLSEDMVDNPLYPQLEPMNGNLDDLYERERLSNNLSRGSPMGPPEGSPMGLPEEQLDPEVRAGRNLFNFLPFRNYFGQN